MICCLLLSVFVSLIGRSYPQTTLIRDVVPKVIWVFQSNEYDQNVGFVQDDQCSVTANEKRSSGAEILLTCAGPNSTLFDGVIGADEPQGAELLQYYTWRRQFTPRPYVAMSFDPPLVELPNTTLYFYHAGGDIQAAISISICFSRSPDYNPCQNVEVPEFPRARDGVIVRSVMLPTNATSVAYLRIDMELLPPHDDHPQDYIFLSEIRVAERLQELPVLASMDILLPVPSPTPSSTTTATSTPLPSPSTPTIVISSQPLMTPMPSATEDGDNNAGISHTSTVTPSPTVANETENVTLILEEGTREENRYRSKLIIGLTVSIVIIIAIVVFFIILIVCIKKRQKKRNLKFNHALEIPMIMGNQNNGINNVQYLNKEPVNFTNERTMTDQAINSQQSQTVEYSTIDSPVPPVYDYVGDESKSLDQEMDLQIYIYSNPDHNATEEHQSIDREGYYSEPALETDYWDNVDDDNPYDDVVVAPYLSVYADPEPLEKSNPPLTVTWDNIKPLEALGSGQFGAVVLSEVLHFTEEQIGLSRGYANISSPILVAIKTLKKDPSEENKKAFEKEIKFMSCLNHRNVIRLLGICTTGTPFIMMEYMENGDLNQFLKKHTFAPRYEMEENNLSVNEKILVYISLQIAGGMQYLSGHKFIHRDLATRNILVGHDFAVKVADFGMSQNLYSDYYFRVKGHQILPIRWIPFESFKGKFSVKSDVWSFGVTMWEIFTVCKKRPYQGWTDKEVVKDAMNKEKRSLLEQTEHCSNEVYAIMKSCWKYNPNDRNNFNDLYSQLYYLYSKLPSKK